MFRKNRGNEVVNSNAISAFRGKVRKDWESKGTEYGNVIYRLLWHSSVNPKDKPDLFQDMLPTTPEGEIEWVLACMEHNKMEYIKYANIQPPEKLQRIIDLINNDVYPKVSDIEVPIVEKKEKYINININEHIIYDLKNCKDDLIEEHVKGLCKTRQKEKNTSTNMMQTLVLRHNDSNIKNLVSVTKRDKTVGITFTTDFLIVMAVNDYVAGCIPIILYARNFSMDTVYNRFLSTVGKMATKRYNSMYFGGRIPDFHLMNGQLRRDYHYEAVQLAIKMDEIIKKDLKI